MKLSEMLSQLNEMPYIHYNKPIVFDLEEEKFKSNEEQVDYVKAILDGKVTTDKYGNKLEFETFAQKEKFVNDMIHDWENYGLISRINHRGIDWRKELADYGFDIK